LSAERNRLNALAQANNALELANISVTRPEALSLIQKVDMSDQLDADIEIEKRRANLDLIKNQHNNLTLTSQAVLAYTVKQIEKNAPFTDFPTPLK